LLADHHREIDAGCQALLAGTYADDSLELIEQYRTFEHAILEHLAAEEELVLPSYAEAAPEDARRLQNDHAALRERLYEVGVAVELHAVRAQTLSALVDQLRIHAAREEEALYPWAQEHLALPAKRQLFARIGQSLRELARRAEARASRPAE
jgi:iron-sulfur cluster repair protein YtfE (RIC family)